MSRNLHAVGVLVAYLVLSAWYTSPLLELSHSHVAHDRYDPVLNASILWWNATTIPFSTEWWNPPYFYPSHGVSAFTENLVGVSLFASPVYWLTRNPLTAYNVALYLTWPLSAFATYLLVLFLTSRQDAAFLAGLAYGFAPYRAAEMAHIQTVSSYWLPVILLGLHGFLDRRRGVWLLLFGVSWLMQSLANGYFMLFAAVLIALWILYFCSTRDSWRAVPAIVATWILASLPLVPVLWKYRAVHEHFGLRRSMGDAITFSASSHGWFEVSNVVWLWSRFLRESLDNLFPGVTALSLVLLGVVVVTWRARPNQPISQRRKALILSLAAAAAASLLVILVTLAVGPWHAALPGLELQIVELDTAIGVLFWSGVPLVLLTVRTREALGRRSLLVFYVAATVLMAVLCSGPVMKVGDAVVLEPMPYRWLMHLPGFSELRAPRRFWMLGTLCLAVCAGLAFVRLVHVRRPFRQLACGAIAIGLLLDGWMRAMPMAEAPQLLPRVERRDYSQPILEVPLGPEWDAAATFRSIWHRRRVVNGVSGYEPPHYTPLQAGLNARDPEILRALASLGAFDVVLNDEEDRDGAWARYVGGAPGVERVGGAGVHTVYRIPEAAWTEPVLGEPLPVAGVRVSAQDSQEARIIADGRRDTVWGKGPQDPGQWVTIDLGDVRQVGGVSYALGEFAGNFPRRLAIDLSVDGSAWESAWEGPTAARAFRTAVDSPRDATVRIAFAARPARFVRLRQLDRDLTVWRIAELRAHSP
jgi:hypothetical protein